MRIATEPSVEQMVSYYRDPERTVEAMRGGWFHTGDYARQDEDGFFFCSMRKWCRQYADGAWSA